MTQDIPDCISDLFGKCESHDYARPVTDRSGKWQIVAETLVSFHVQPGDTVRMLVGVHVVNGIPGGCLVLQRQVQRAAHVRRLIAIVDRGELKLKLGLE